MSISKCPKCGKSIFQIESLTPIGSNRDVITVICHNCSSITGTLDHEPIAKDQEEIKLQMQVINRKLDTINQNIGQIMNGIKLIYKRIEDNT